jgi:ribose-phosphate pyrophosphokinase
MRIHFPYEECYEPQALVFGGEIHVNVFEFKSVIQDNSKATVSANLRSSDDIMALLMFTDAIRRANPRIRLTLSIPYLPYARQDRVCSPGEALSVRVMADLINSMRYEAVFVCHPHSDVGPACINNCQTTPPEYIIDNFDDLSTKIKGMTIIAPDAGAEKACYNVSKYFGGLDVISCSKIRDPKDGSIVATDVHYGFSLRNTDVLIVDDICDGGMTFIKIAERLRERIKPRSISLYVTHGIFSKGKGVLFDAGIDKIYTTNSFPNDRVGLEDRLFVHTL